MRPGDELPWDVDNMHYCIRRLYEKARGNGWSITISCNPPLKPVYTSNLKGRLTIRRQA